MNARTEAIKKAKKYGNLTASPKIHREAHEDEARRTKENPRWKEGFKKAFEHPIDKYKRLGHDPRISKQGEARLAKLYGSAEQRKKFGV